MRGQSDDPTAGSQSQSQSRESSRSPSQKRQAAEEINSPEPAKPAKRRKAQSYLLTRKSGGQDEEEEEEDLSPNQFSGRVGQDAPASSDSSPSISSGNGFKPEQQQHVKQSQLSQSPSATPAKGGATSEPSTPFLISPPKGQDLRGGGGFGHLRFSSEEESASLEEKQKPAAPPGATLRADTPEGMGGESPLLTLTQGTREQQQLLLQREESFTGSTSYSDLSTGLPISFTPTNLVTSTAPEATPRRTLGSKSSVAPSPFHSFQGDTSTDEPVD